MSEELPTGWKRVPLSDVADVRLGRQRSPDRAQGPHMRPYVRAANVTWSGIDLSDVKEMDFSPKEFETYRLLDGDILLSEASGSAAEVGKPAIWRGQVANCCFQNTLIRVRSRGPLPEYLHLHFLADARLGKFASAGKGIGINHLGADRMSSWPTAIPPEPEQRRIVAKLEALQARSRRARQALDAVPVLLEKLRQSILAAAFRGDLTKEWRAKNKNVEPASELLKRIRIERRKKWEEAELAKMKAKGKAPKDDKWKAKYKEPEPVDTAGLPELPEGWCWASVDEICVCFDGDRVPLKEADRAKRSGAFPYYGASGVIDAIDEYLFDGEFLLIAEDGANLLSRSKPIAFQATGRFWVNNHAHVVQTVLLPLSYLEHRLNGIRIDEWVSGTAQPKLTQKNLNSIPVPLCPLSEGNVLIRAIESAFERFALFQRCVVGTFDQLDQLARVVLAKAFRGELVAHDGNELPPPSGSSSSAARRARPSAPEPPRSGARSARGRKRAS